MFRVIGIRTFCFHPGHSWEELFPCIQWMRSFAAVTKDKGVATVKVFDQVSLKYATLHGYVQRVTIQYKWTMKSCGMQWRLQHDYKLGMLPSRCSLRMDTIFKFIQQIWQFWWVLTLHRAIMVVGFSLSSQQHWLDTDVMKKAPIVKTTRWEELCGKWAMVKVTDCQQWLKQCNHISSRWQLFTWLHFQQHIFCNTFFHIRSCSNMASPGIYSVANHLFHLCDWSINPSFMALFSLYGTTLLGGVRYMGGIVHICSSSLLILNYT